jgi:hypothetical protein
VKTFLPNYRTKEKLIRVKTHWRWKNVYKNKKILFRLFICLNFMDKIIGGCHEAINKFGHTGSLLSFFGQRSGYSAG